MLTWFAGALMRGYDEHAAGAAKSDRSPGAESRTIHEAICKIEVDDNGFKRALIFSEREAIADAILAALASRKTGERP